jgi:hypothetical protein
MAQLTSGGRTDSDERPLTGPGAPCFHCKKSIPEFKPNAKRRTRKTAEFCDDACRMANHRSGGEPAAAKSKCQHVVSYPGEQDRASRRQAQARRSLLETGAPSVRELIAAWYRRHGVDAEVVQLVTSGDSPEVLMRMAA